MINQQNTSNKVIQELQNQIGEKIILSRKAISKVINGTGRIRRGAKLMSQYSNRVHHIFNLSFLLGYLSNKPYYLG